MSLIVLAGVFHSTANSYLPGALHLRVCQIHSVSSIPVATALVLAIITSHLNCCHNKPTHLPDSQSFISSYLSSYHALRFPCSNALRGFSHFQEKWQSLFHLFSELCLPLTCIHPTLLTALQFLPHTICLSLHRSRMTFSTFSKFNHFSGSSTEAPVLHDTSSVYAKRKYYYSLKHLTGELLNFPTTVITYAHISSLL